MSGRRKNTLLFLGLLVLLILAYQFSFKKTFELAGEIRTLSKQKLELDNAISKLDLLEQENKYLDSVLTQNDLKANQSFGQNLLEKVNALKEKYNLQIVSIIEPHKFEKDGTTIETYVIEVKGDFRDLMLFSSSLEQLRLGTFVSVDFNKKQNYKTRRKQLVTKIVLQRLTK